LGGHKPDLQCAGMVARSQVWRLVALGSTINAQTGRLVRTGHVCGSFTGNNISVLCPKEEGAGKIEIQIDGAEK